MHKDYSAMSHLSKTLPHRDCHRADIFRAEKKEGKKLRAGKRNPKCLQLKYGKSGGNFLSHRIVFVNTWHEAFLPLYVDFNKSILYLKAIIDALSLCVKHLGGVADEV